MKIKINKHKFNLFVSQILNEANYPTFGNGSHTINYKPYIDSISKIENLHSDRYKDYELENAYNSWKGTGFNKNSDEYKLYISAFKKFMFGTGGFLRNLSYHGVLSINALESIKSDTCDRFLNSITLLNSSILFLSFSSMFESSNVQTNLALASFIISS